MIDQFEIINKKDLYLILIFRMSVDVAQIMFKVIF